jgi:endoribonuclease Dicer
LDWIVTERLYKAEGKNYSPGHMHLRKQAIVNAHFLAFICLRAFVTTDTTMPHWDELQGVTLVEQEERIHLFQCMLHSSRLVLDDQEFSFARFQKLQELIEKALDESTTFPWEQLVRLQAPKFLCDIVESLIGAVWLDSEGNFEVVFGMLERLGIIGVLDRIVSQDVDVQVGA